MNRAPRTAPLIALSTCASHPGMMAGDDEALIDALEPMGFVCERPRWDDDSVDWGGYDAVLIRTTWDYQEKLGAFMAWVERVSERTTLLNPAPVVRANVDKRYLRELERVGAAIVPTRWIEGPITADELGALVAGGRPVDGVAGVLKPVVGAGASGLMMFRGDELERGAAHARGLVEACGGAMLQAPVGSIRSRGELSVVLIDGEVTHAVRKRPSEGDWRVQIEFGGRYELEQPGEREPAISRLAVESLGGGETPLYARIDLVEVEGMGPAVIEAELIEPELFFPMAPGSARAFGVALGRRLGVSLGSDA